MNLAELTDLELAELAVGKAERHIVVVVAGANRSFIGAQARDDLESLFRELRQAWQKTTVSYHRGQVHWRTEQPIDWEYNPK